MTEPGTTRIELLSPAKLNLFLHINGRRRDGYHQLQTIFQLLDYGDLMRFTPLAEPRIELVCGVGGLADEHNLAYRAARLLQARGGTPRGAAIHLEKRLPIGGGLGGGSSNAATALLALNRLWSLNLSTAQLATLGLELGADVPVFVHGHSAWGEGRGELLTPLALPERWYTVITPPCQVATREIFAHRQLTRNTSPIKIPAFPVPGDRNDCEPVAGMLYPVIQQTLDWLGRYGRARMTGTGASVFAAFTDKQRAVEALNNKPAGCTGFVARGIDTSPVHLALEGRA